MKKEKTKTWYKKKLDSVFSRYIREKYEKDGKVPCYTCPHIGTVKTMQCGHFVPRQHMSTRWDEDNCRPQCLTKESYIRLFNGLNKSVQNVKVGEKIWGFDEKSFEKMICTVETVESFLPEKVYEVELENGDRFFATGDHRVVANGEWKRIDEMLHNATAYNILEM